MYFYCSSMDYTLCATVEMLAGECPAPNWGPLASVMWGPVTSVVGTLLSGPPVTCSLQTTTDYINSLVWILLSCTCTCLFFLPNNKYFYGLGDFYGKCLAFRFLFIMCNINFTVTVVPDSCHYSTILLLY